MIIIKLKKPLIFMG